MKRSKPKQLELTLRTWGGHRQGSGRKPKGKKAGIAHRRREGINKHHPVHVTVRLRPDLRSLRAKAKMQVMRKAFAASQRIDFRITDWSVQHDHVHLVCESNNAKSLSNGMRGFTGRVAKGLNRLHGRQGQVFVERYHTHVLATPREVRTALAYVLGNARHHNVKIPPDQPDPCSSAIEFDGWRDWRLSGLRWSLDETAVAQPQTWLRVKGWRKHGLLSVHEIPGCK